MKNSVVIAIFSFLKQETKLIINAIKFPYNFVKEFSILRFLCYLIDNYKEEEDLFKKMMEFQEKNNDRHTINYNLLK